jgi:hypothetical protein
VKDIEEVLEIKKMFFGKLFRIFQLSRENLKGKFPANLSALIQIEFETQLTANLIQLLSLPFTTT